MTCYLSHCLSREQIVTQIMEKEEEVMVSVLLALIRSHVETGNQGIKLGLQAYNLQVVWGGTSCCTTFCT